MCVNEVKVRSPAKVNLYLDVLGTRTDGYHEVEMVLQTVNLFDKVVVKRTDDCKISLNCTNKVTAKEQDNIAYIAAEKFFEYTEIKNVGINIDIKKEIPQGAGLAGGSTDAAATLIGLNILFGSSLSKRELAKIGEKIGMDVPFCVYGGTMLATGLGTTLTQLPTMPKCWIVIVKPDFLVSTKNAYEAADIKPLIPNKSTISNLISAIKDNNLRDVATNIYNRFESILNFEKVSEIKKILNKYESLNSCMTGTGSAVYGIFDDKKKAINCQINLSKNYEQIFVVTPTGGNITEI